MLSCSVARVATTRLAARAGCQHAAAASSSSSSSSAAAAGWQQMQPAAVASRVVMTPTISRMGWTPARGIAGPSASTSHTAANKGARSKRTGADAQQDALEHDVEREANQTAEVTTQDVAAQAAAKKAAREAKKAKKAGTVQAEKLSESEQRRIKKEAQKAASQRADQKFKASVIEKEVPLMDLTGIKPGQNMFTNVLDVMRGEQIPTGIVTDLEQIGDYASGSTAEILSGKIANLAAKYGRKPHDTGSPEVQIAIMTERLKGYDRHMVEHKSDINSRRGFLATWHRRRKMLKYLRRTKYETYAYIMKELQLRESDIDSVGLDRTSGTQAARIKKD